MHDTHTSAILISPQQRSQNVDKEWKGKGRTITVDTQYREEIGKIWEKLGNGKCFFFLVTKDNKEEIIDKIKKL